MDPADPSDGSSEAEAHEPGRMLLGRFRIERTLGHGGMGEVLLARDTLLNRRVALKRWRADRADAAERRESILREARRASQINDPRIAAIHDVLVSGDEILIVMEYVEGTTLRERLATPLTLDQFRAIALPCVDALGAAHAHGVIHRDIKPENLMLPSAGGVKILDFGLARRSESFTETSTTQTGRLESDTAGTPQYMAPEALLGQRVDERTDLFALGVVFYEMLAGRRPFADGPYTQLVGNILSTVPAPLSEANPSVPAPLSSVVAKLLEKDPAARYASTGDLRSGLEAVLAGGAGPKPAARPAAPRRVPRAAAAALIGAAVIALAWLAWARVAATALPKDRNLAVLAPLVRGGDQDFTSFALGSTDLLAARLQRRIETPGFQTASFGEGLEENVREAADARKVLGATLALRAAFENQPDVLRARLELFDAANGRVIAARTIERPATEPFEFLDREYRDACAMLGLAPPADSLREASGVRGAGTLRFWLQGVGRVRVAKSADDAKRAIADLEIACRTDPTSAVARAALASAQLAADGYEAGAGWLARGEATAREAVALDSSRAEGHRVLARALTIQRDFPASLPEFERAFEIDPTSDEVCTRLGRTYGRVGQPEKEKEFYLGVIRRRPHNWQPYWWLATWHFRQGHVDESVRAYEDMIRRAPALYKGYSSLGGLLVLRGEYARAIEMLKRSVALRPAKTAFDNLGTAYFNSGHLDAAVDAYNQSFQFGVAEYESWFNLGDAYYWSHGREADARNAYTEGVRLAHEKMLNSLRQGRTADVMIPANLATVFPRIGQPDSARFYLARALAADSANSMVQYCASLTYWQLHERDRAVAWLEKSVQGGYPVIWLRDSPIFREWREAARFRALIGDTTGAAPQAARNREGGGP